jgi:hypothetical protein
MDGYRHTQPGWVILAVAAATAAVAQAGLPPGVPSWPLFLVVAILVLFFGALTVEVGADALRLRFGIGLVRKRIPLGDVVAWREVRNPWYTGWGIRLGPGYVIWNVSGRDAVELALAGGRRFRVGTDEPAELLAALARAKGAEPAWPPPGLDGPPTRAGFGVKALALVLVPLLALVGGLFWWQVQPPTVVVRPDGLEVGSLFYGRTFPAAGLLRISLESSLPRVLARTNGFSGAGSLRGHFRVEGLGDGLLFVEEGFSPYILVRLREGFVALNFREPGRTRAVYGELARAWPDRVAPGAPSLRRPAPRGSRP